MTRVFLFGLAFAVLLVTVAAAEDLCQTCGDEPRFPAEAAFLDAHGYPANDYTVLMSWSELCPNDSDKYVTGYHLVAASGGKAFDLYSDGADVLLTDAEVAALGIIKKNWALPPIELASELPEAVDKALPRSPAPVGPARSIALDAAVVAPEVDVERAVREDEEEALSAGKGAQRIGLNVALEQAITVQGLVVSDGTWQEVPGSGWLWSVGLFSPDALGMRVHFSEIALPPGAQIVVYNYDAPQEAYGPYFGPAPGATDLWGATCFSDAVVVECLVPSDADRADVRLTIDRITHNYVPMGEIGWAKAAGGCNLDVACYPGWSSTSTAVGGIGSVGSNGALWCTGSLLADSDPGSSIPYFLTANHCVGTADAAASVEIYWLYQTATCAGAPPNPATVPRTIGGAALLATSPASTGTDFCLLRLNNPAVAGVAYAGWLNAPNALGTSTVCIHHPSGDYKRISFGSVTDVPETSRLDLPAARYYQSSWSAGVTEPGSSGSPLFNGSTQQVVGQLWGGPSSCDPESIKLDYYGRFDVSFPLMAGYLNAGPPSPPNDNFLNALDIFGAPAQATGTNVNATAQTGEPSYVHRGKSVWWDWTAPEYGLVTIDTIGSNFDTVLGVYTGSALGALTAVGEDDDGAGSANASRVSFLAVPGAPYRIAVDGYGGYSGNITLNISSITPQARTFGNTTVFGSTVQNANRPAMPVLVTENGALLSVSMYHASGTGNMILGVYGTGANGLPGPRLGVTASTPVSGVEGWQTIPLISPAPVTAGQTVWLAWVYQNPVTVRYQAGSPGRALASIGWAGGMPNPFGTSIQSNSIYSIYATFTANVPVPTVQFSQASSAGSEATSPANVQVTLSAAATQTVTVNYAATGGTATGGGVDYTLASGQLSFSPGQTSKSIAIAIGNDIVPEPNETIVVSLSGPINAILGTPASHTYTIQDNDSAAPLTIGNTAVFSQTVQNANRVAMPYFVAVGGALNAVSMYHDGGTGNMILGVYGTGANGLPGPRLGETAATAVNAAAGWQTIPLPSPVPVTAGQTIWLAWIYENPVSVHFQAGLPGRATGSGGYSAGMPNPFGASSQGTVVYSICATYVPVPTTVQFSPANPGGPEFITPTNVQVVLSSTSAQTVTVNYAVTGGTATGGGVDYTLANGQLSFAAGETSKPIALNIMNDRLAEPNETIVITLSAPVNATLGSPASRTFTIQDDDTPGPASSVVGWGDNGYGQCTAPPPNTGFTAVAAGYYHSLGLKTDGSIVAWGWNQYGQCNVPEPNTGFVAMSAGYYHGLGLKTDGSIMAWGYNSHGQCAVPTPNTGFVAVSAGHEHSLAIRSDGSIVAWGQNDYGQCNVPRVNTGFVAVSAGYRHSLALRANGSVAAWGSNAYGNCTVPVPNTGFVSVSAGNDHSVGLKADGWVVVWGGNTHGEQAIPSVNKDFVAAKAGYQHTLGLKVDGSVAAWGWNRNLQCSVPAPNTGFVGVSGGFGHSLGLKALPSVQPNVQFSLASSAGAEATTPANVQVSLSAASTQTVAVSYAVTGGTATGSGVDYTLPSGQLSFSPGQTSKPIAIAIANDGAPEPDETIVVTLYAPVNATLGTRISHTYTIHDDDIALPMTIGNTTVFGSTVQNANRPAMPFLVTEDGALESVSMYHASGTGNMILGVYGTGTNGLPGPRLGVTASTPVSAAAGWQTIPLISPAPVVAGQTIWLAWVYQNPVTVRFQAGSPGRALAPTGWAGGMPSSFGTSTQSNSIYSIYATYCVRTIMLPGNVPLELAWCPAGTFPMGRYSGEQDSFSYESPQHSVSVQDFWMSKYEVTKAQWTAVMGTTPWVGQANVLSDPASPAAYVSWDDAQDFIAALNDHIASTGQGAATLRLPSEAEWEYAARADTLTRFYWGDDPGSTEISDYAWWYGNGWTTGQAYAHVVGLKLPNDWGLYDMSGNVWEWCEDDWHGNYTGAPVDGSAWVNSPRAAERVIRGGAAYNNGLYCRSASRSNPVPTHTDDGIGFRLAR